MENAPLTMSSGGPNPRAPTSTASQSNPFSVAAVTISNDAVFIETNPDHSFQAIREQIFESNDTILIPAPMNGFAQQAESILPSMDKTVICGFKS
ncbi:hypothetical protein PHAVU_006G079000 [Phaseolus vulgaris]|uniref:Uncharacterized protein n=1 Tax=Phaseolus vulgaris TaxID=3885 RepID=V7BPC3_PHAVU|nr:hypothetical protein PHAVU_006G079000g [Phaseolus vulgaris]ESW18883.1 hypothetical protein PHAVU_006G079000g [Phaseolus vulgaris]